CVLVKPQATSPLLPATSEGTPGSVTPATWRGRESCQAVDARYQMFGVARPRCMSLAMMAPPSLVRRPATAQLLLPRASSSIGGESDPSSALRAPASPFAGGWAAAGVMAGAVRTSNALASGIAGSPRGSPTSG